MVEKKLLKCRGKGGGVAGVGGLKSLAATLTFRGAGGGGVSLKTKPAAQPKTPRGGSGELRWPRRRSPGIARNDLIA